MIWLRNLAGATFMMNPWTRIRTNGRAVGAATILVKELASLMHRSERQPPSWGSHAVPYEGGLRVENSKE